jgi:hypothetical protein
MNPRLLHLALLAGCGNPISNALFLEDAEFAAAVPSFEQLRIDFPAQDTSYSGADIPPPGHASDLRSQSAAVAANLELTLADLAALGTFIRTDEPSLREEDLRSWGPSSLENGSRSLLLVDVVRSGEAQYDWAFMLGESSAGPWQPFFEGTHYSGATVAEGDGVLEADIGSLADALGQEREGRVLLDYDLREGVEVQLDLRGYRETEADRAVDIRYRYEADGAGAGDFQYGLEAELSPGDALERVGVRTRWKASTAMRADSRMEEGDLGSEVFTMSQCWDESGVLVFQDDSWDLLPEIGAESACAYGKPLFAEDW